jgi:hypothetical protein
MPKAPTETLPTRAPWVRCVKRLSHAFQPNGVWLDQTATLIFKLSQTGQQSTRLRLTTFQICWQMTTQGVRLMQSIGLNRE